MADLIRTYLHASRRRRLLVPVWLPGKTARAIRAGGNLIAEPVAAAPTAGGRTWEEFLAERLR